MRGTIVRIGVTGAGALLALGLLAAPPAGADESGQQGKSKRSEPASCFDASEKTQGGSQSDPDGMDNGGPDKPGCDGGFDDDRDGNNGCGNDADREDDNNGNCGGVTDVDEPDGYDSNDDDAPAPSSSTTTTTEPVEVSPVTEEDSDEPEDTSDTESDDTSDTESDDASDTESDDASDTESDDASDTADSSDTTDDSDADSETEAPASSDDSSDEEPAPLAKAGVGFGGLALLGGLVRLFLRIG